MPRTNSRKRNSRRNESTARVSVASSLSPNAPEFIPIGNDETAIHSRELAIQPIPFCGSSRTPNTSGNDTNSNNSGDTNTSSSISDPLSNKGQRDLLINLLNNSKVDCVICYERAKNVEPIWNCRNCYQIMHLKCIMVWYIKSHNNATWRCPACQNELTGKPTYYCFCGALPNPFSNNVDTPHSCGQVCGLVKKNLNIEYNDCHHKCTLLCHPGPCPQCVVQVLRDCCCGRTKNYAHCGQSAPIVCQNICSKELNCKNHICEKPCHANQCEPCKKNCPQSAVDQNNQDRTVIRITQYFGSVSNNGIPNSAYVTEDELRMLGLNPEELLHNSNDDEDSNILAYFDSDDPDGLFEPENYDFHDEEDYDDDDDDDNDDDLLNDPSVRFYDWSDGEDINTSRFILPTGSDLIDYLAVDLDETSTSEESSSSSSSSSSNENNDNDNNGLRINSIQDDSDSNHSSIQDDFNDHNCSIQNCDDNHSLSATNSGGDRGNDSDMDVVSPLEESEQSCSSWSISDFNSDEVNTPGSSSSDSSSSDSSIIQSSSSFLEDSSSFSVTSDANSNS